MSNNQMFTDGFELFRDAQVHVTETTDKAHKPIVVIEVGGYEHQFNSKSRVSQALKHNSVDKIAERFNGGDFFFKDGELINFQYGNRKGFCHTDDSIQSLIDNVGYSVINRRSGGALINNRTQSHSIALRAERSNVEIDIPEYSTGGEMESRLSFAWDPFQSYVSTSFELVRLICANGMSGLTSFLNNKIPLVNRWEENLEIANKQIQNTITNMLQKRMVELNSMRASVRDCQRVVDYCKERLANSTFNHANEKATNILMNNAYIADPELHLADHYQPNVLNDRRVSDQLASHLSLFTVWNMLTEIASHTSVGESAATDFSIHKHANEIMFDRGVVSNNSADSQAGKIKLDPVFANVEAALVGDQL